MLLPSDRCHCVDLTLIVRMLVSNDAGEWLHDQISNSEGTKSEVLIILRVKLPRIGKISCKSECQTIPHTASILCPC
jgi:hypothetical protein